MTSCIPKGLTAVGRGCVKSDREARRAAEGPLRTPARAPDTLLLRGEAEQSTLSTHASRASCAIRPKMAVLVLDPPSEVEPAVVVRVVQCVFF